MTSTPQVGIILFARMSSSRLPGKMLRQIGPTTLLERMVSRARLLDAPLLLATSTHASDDLLVQRASALGVETYRGALDDVLGRACDAARSAGFDAFARLCGDRPFFPLEDMQLGLATMRDALGRGRPCDLLTTAWPDAVPPGLVTEIVRTAAVERLRHGRPSAESKEHVTAAFYVEPRRYAVEALPTALRGLGRVPMAVDTEEDLRRLATLIEAQPAIDFPAQRAVALATAMPEALMRPAAHHADIQQ